MNKRTFTASSKLNLNQRVELNDKLVNTEKTESNFKALKKEIKLLGEKFENKSLDFNHLKSELEKWAEEGKSED